MTESPSLLVFAGPNGSGKTTVTKAFPVFGIYINADDIKRSEGSTDLEAVQKATALREYLLSRKNSFTFETVLSTERNLKLLRRAKAAGYHIQVVFALTSKADINVERVRQRVKNGGHSVPEDKIRSRYYKSLANIPTLLEICDMMDVFDNSGSEPSILLRLRDKRVSFFENSFWSIDDLIALVKRK